MRVVLNGLQAGNRSGTGRYTEQLARALLERADKGSVTVLWPGETPLPAGAEAHEACFERVAATHPFRRIAADQVLIRSRMRGLGADLVHYPATVGAAFGHLPSVVTVHDLSFLVEPKWFRRDRALYLRLMASRSARRALRVIAVSHATAEVLQERLGIPADRIDVAYQGIEPRFAPASREAIRAARERYGLPEDYLLFMGTLEPRKNLPALLRAFEATADRHRLHLVIAGRTGWRIDGFLSALRHSPLAERIHLPGYVAEIDQAAILSGAHAFVWPSVYEGFGFPPLEAMACGVPVLASNASVMPEALGDAALLTDAQRGDAIAAALMRIIEDEPLRAELVRRGIRRAAAFDWGRTAIETLEVYRRALGEGGEGAS